MTKFIPSIIAGLVISLSFISGILFSQSPLDVVSADHRFVGMVDMKKAKDKAGAMNITNLNYYQVWLEDMENEEGRSSLDALFGNPEARGIDTSGKMVFFGDIENIEEDLEYVGFAFPLNDSKKWEEWIHSGNPVSNQPVRDFHDFKYIGDNEFALAWSSDKAVLLNSGVYDSEGDMVQKMQEVWKTAPGKSIADNDKFKVVAAEDWDALLWLNMSFMSNFLSEGNVEMKGLAKDVGQIQSTVLKVNFLPDEVKFDLDFFFNENTNLLNFKELIKPMDARIAGFLPSSNLIASMALSLDMKKSMVSLNTNESAAMGGFLSMGGPYDLDVLLPALKGDILMTVSDINIEKENFHVAVAASVGDQKILDQWIGKLSRKKLLIREKGNSSYSIYQFASDDGKSDKKRTQTGGKKSGGPSFYLISKAGWLFFANSGKQERWNSIGKIAPSGKPDLLDFIQTNYFSIYLDYQELLRQLYIKAPEVSMDEYSQFLLSLKDKLKDIRIYPSVPDSQRATIHADFNLMTDGKNSMPYILKWADELASGNNDHNGDY